MSDAIVEIKNLFVNRQNKREKVATPLVKGIDLTIPQGQVVGIIGESGSGKSLSMKASMGLLPENLHSQFGEFRFKGNSVKNPSELPIAMIFQDPMTSLNPLRKIGYHLAEVIFRNDEEISDEDAEKLAIKVLSQVGIPEPEKRLNQYPFELSGGMWQRIMIAMALLAKPELLIADEPTTALDVTIQAQILSLLKRLQVEDNLSIVLVSHDFSVIAGMCDLVKVMFQGQIVEEGAVDEIFNNPLHAYTKQLLAAADLDLIDTISEKKDYVLSNSFKSVSSSHRYLVEE
ncbi:ABC transporter ATP-binding protein [Streptococcus sobrinus]|uniref:ABC transporter ATP-binding protein n=1 Tax=Streptococcus sobrinus TaxID=1310 RepID=UPI0002DF9E0B|nr:ABC transporter ATP-binding protein [Streptococcus sobrinus]